MKKFQTLLIVILALIAADLFLNGGRVMAIIATSASGQAAIVTSLDSQNLVNSMPPRSVTIDTSAPTVMTFDQPVFAVPTALAPVIIQHNDPAPAVIMIQAEPETSGCRGGRSCPRPAATAAPEVGR